MAWLEKSGDLLEDDLVLRNFYIHEALPKRYCYQLFTCSWLFPVQKKNWQKISVTSVQELTESQVSVQRRAFRWKYSKTSLLIFGRKLAQKDWLVKSLFLLGRWAMWYLRQTQRALQNDSGIISYAKITGSARKYFPAYMEKVILARSDSYNRTVLRIHATSKKQTTFPSLTWWYSDWEMMEHTASNNSRIQVQLGDSSTTAK